MGLALAGAITAGVGAAAGAAGGIAKFYEGRDMQRKAQQAIDNFQWKELTNPYKNLQVSTLGSDLQREEQSRMAATSVNALRQGGNRAIIGGLGRVESQNNMVNRQIGAGLDQQQKQIDFAAAQDDTRIREMEERRQANELQGYGQQLNVGMNTKYGGIADISNGISSIGQSMMTIGSMPKGAGNTLGTSGSGITPPAGNGFSTPVASQSAQTYFPTTDFNQNYSGSGYNSFSNGFGNSYGNMFNPYGNVYNPNLNY